jgi:ribose transport system permease protein
MILALRKDKPKSRALTLARKVNIAVIVLIALYLAIGIRQPIYLEPAGVMNFLRRAAPLAILASGQLFVLTSGGFDLSVGSLVTLTVIGGSMLTANDPANTWWTIGFLYTVGLAVGLLNGLIVAYLKVPSIIATLGMLLSVNGAAMLWSGGGAPRGYLPENFRMFGRFVLHDVPIIGIFPLAIAVLAVVGGLAYWGLHWTVFGRWVFAVGDNPRAAELAGVRVDLVRVAVFIISALSAVTAGIMLGGFGGVSVDVGLGLELQAVAACVVGGVQLMGGRGTLVGAVAGALTLFALFTLLTLLGLPQPLKDTAQGFILIAAVAIGAWRRRRAA